MDLQLQGRTALVTGASQGIGRAVARILAREGVKLAVVARRKPLLEVLSSEITAAGGAKAATHVWAKGLSREIALHNITINSLQPGRIRSEQIDKRYPTDEARHEFSAAEIPAGRFGETDEIANLAVFLVSPLAGYVTGTVIPVDGGMSRFAF